jgi:hypothetical protein
MRARHGPGRKVHRASRCLATRAAIRCVTGNGFLRKRATVCANAGRRCATHSRHSHVLRVGKEVTPLSPHGPKRAQLTHLVLRRTGLLTDQCSDGATEVFLRNTEVLSRPYHAASTLGAYASSNALLHSHARLATGCWLGIAGRESNPLNSDERFRSVTPNFLLSQACLARRKRSFNIRHGRPQGRQSEVALLSVRVDGATQLQPRADIFSLVLLQERRDLGHDVFLVPNPHIDSR